MYSDPASQRRAALCIRLAIFGHYAGLALVALHVTRWLKFDRGVGEGFFSLIICSGYLASFLTQPLWGMAADRARRRRTPLRVSWLGAGLLYLTLGLAGDRMPLGAVWAVVVGAMVFFTPGIPMLNSIALKHVGPERAEDFAYYRVLGSVSFMLCSLALPPLLLGWLGLPRASLLVVGGLMFLGSIFTAYWPAQAPESRPRPRWRDAGRLLRIPTLFWLYVVNAALYISMGGVMIFIGPYFELMGAGEGAYAVAWGVGVAGEIPALLLLPRLARRFGLKPLLAVSILLDAARFALIALAPSPGWLVAGWCLHSFGSMGHFVILPTLISARAPGELRSTAQSVYGALFSLGMILGTLVARWIIAGRSAPDLLMGYRLYFALVAVGLAVAATILIVFFRDAPPAREADGSAA